MALASPERGSNFYLGFLALPRHKREALAKVYGFCRMIDDIVDEGASPQEARRQLAFWRGEIEALYAGRPGHERTRELEPIVLEHRLPKEGFLELIRGVGMDLERSRYETFAELEPYLFGVAGAVGLLCVRVFGYAKTPEADARAYAVALGNAFQLTNILRDVGSDLERGRIYIPLEDLRACGCSLDAFLRREHSPAFVAAMTRQYERAKGYYRRARNCLHPEDRPAMLPAEIMAAIYEGLLEAIREGGYRVFFERARLPLWRKVALAAGAWGRAHGIY